MVFKGQNRRYSRELKLTAIKRMERGESIVVLADELGVRASRLYEWRQTYELCGDVSLRVRCRPPGPESSAERPPVRADAGSDSGVAEPAVWRDWLRPSGGSASWSARSASRSSISIFFSKPCGVSGRNAP